MRARELVTDLGLNTSEYGEWLDGPVLAQELRGFKHTGDGLLGPNYVAVNEMLDFEERAEDASWILGRASGGCHD